MSDLDNAAYQDTDDAEAVMVLAAVRHCANSWDGSARLVGNVRARDISRACTIAINALAQAPMDMDYILPCDVHLPPATRIRKGCKLSTLLTGLRVREGAEFQAMVVPSTMQLCPDWRTCKCKDGCAHSSTHQRSALRLCESTFTLTCQSRPNR